MLLITMLIAALINRLTSLYVILYKGRVQSVHIRRNISVRVRREDVRAGFTYLAALG